MSTAALTLRARLQRTGIRRVGGARAGFRYRRASGAALSAAECARIAALNIPPGWRDVRIAPRAGSAVQAIGRDAAGRWQYRYATSHAARRSRRKFDRLVAFARALPALRAAVRRDLKRADMDLERACAVAVLLLGATGLRPGSARYAQENGTFGLATLRRRHASVHGALVRLAFTGKHGVRQQHTLRSARLAKLLREMLAMPGRELLQYRRASGRVRDLSREHVDAYVRRAMGARFSLKTFRTWTATLVCAAALFRENQNSAGRESAIRRAIDATATWLGDTPDVTLQSYVHPALFDAYRRGSQARCVLARPELLAERVPRGLHAAERTVVRVIGGR